MSTGNSDKETGKINLAFDDSSRFHLKPDINYLCHKKGNLTGSELLCQLQPGIILRILDVIAEPNESIVTSSRVIIPGGKLCLSFNLIGDQAISLADESAESIASAEDTANVESIVMRERTLWASYNHDSILLDNDVHAEDRFLTVMLLCDPDVLSESPFDLECDQLPDCIRPVIEVQEGFSAGCSMNDESIQSVQALIVSDTSDAYSRAFLQAKTVELLCLALRNISQQEQQKNRTHTSDNECEAVEKAALLLQQRLQEPPSLDEMVGMLGINKTRLMHCFKAIHGCSISSYILKVRMQKARQLLASGELNVTQVAMDLGYEYVSNFVTAFKRELGMTPKAFQLMVLNR